MKETQKYKKRGNEVQKKKLKKGFEEALNKDF
jgi:hypothetical protein